jgi:Rrf2 family protein
LIAALEMATTDGLVTVAGISERYAIPEGALAKVLQQLVRSKIALGSRGVGGGYRLARPAKKISVLEIIEVFDPPHSDRRSGLHQGPEAQPNETRVTRLLDEVDEISRCTFASVSLETLAR